jgi:stage V sporulation protein D (sporulation-specific penicillin-binding protein)/penicillin-binding protein 2B
MGSTLKKSKERSLLVGFVFFLCFAVIFFRLFWIQTVQSDSWLMKGDENWLLKRELKPKRGTIYDRSREQMLAWDVDGYFFMADPRRVKNPDKTANLLAPLLKIDEKKLLQLLKQKKSSVELRDGGHFKYTEDIYQKIQQLRQKGEISGIYPFPTKLRQYNGSEAAHVLGFVNNDGAPVGGVESYYDKLLRGKEGFLQYLKAKNGMMISDKPEKDRSPEPGKDLVLTIDSRIQEQVELELSQAVKNYAAKGGTAIVANPKTGEILAMASYPVFDPNDYSKTINGDNAVNRAVSSQFEPGSTFKIVTLAAAIEEGLFHPDETYQSGSVHVGDQTIRDWNGTGWGTITFRQGVELSSNVAFVKLGERLGDKLIQYIDRFGFGDITQRFGKKTGIDLPAEGRGYFYGRELFPAELATTAFGQGISVTPIQQVAAISAIANGGIWYRPHVLKEVWEPDLSKKISEVTPEGHRILKPETAREVRELLRDVVKEGTGREADVPGYNVAGKTGTAQIPDPKGNGYLPGKYVVSFIGFAPYDDPDIVVYVAIDEPSSENGSVSGGTMAAPVAREILKKTLPIREMEEHRQLAEKIK